MQKNKWYNWLIFALIWIVAGVVNYFSGSDNYFLFQIVIFLALALCQYICDKHGEKGKKVFKYICIGVIVLCIVYLGVIIYNAIK